LGQKAGWTVVYFADGADGAGPDPFAEEASVFRSLITDGDLRATPVSRAISEMRRAS